MEERIIHLKDRSFYQDHLDSDCSFYVQTNATKEQVERIVALSTAIFTNEIDTKNFTTTEIEIFNKLNHCVDLYLSSIIVKVFSAYGYTYKEIEIESVYW